MKKFISRLRSNQGESLIESMAAILVFTLASILFLSMVNGAANINRAAREADDTFAQQQRKIELPTPTDVPDADVTITVQKAVGGGEDILAQEEVVLVQPAGEEGFHGYYLP